MSNPKCAFITGIDSFTGRYLTAELTNHGYEVFGSTRHATGKANEVPCDINDQDTLTEILRRFQPAVIAHLAAITFAAHGSGIEVYKTNLLGTYSLLEAIAVSGVSLRKLLLVSSAHVYGNQPQSPIEEHFLPIPPNDYAVSKLAIENLARLRFDRLPTVVVRPFNYTGIGQSSNFLIPKMIDHFARQAPEIELGNTEVARDFSDVRDVAEIYRRLIDGEAHSVIVNVCSGKSHPLSKILEILTELSGYNLPIRVNPAFVRSNDVKALWGNNSLLRSLIGPLPSRPLEETLLWMYEAEVAAAVV